MPEDSYARVGPGALDDLRQKSEMIVLNEDHGMLGAAHFFNEDFAEFLVHALIIGPIFLAEHGPRVRDVAERPQSLV